MPVNEKRRRPFIVEGLRKAAAIAEHYDGRDPKSDVRTQHRIAQAIREEANRIEEGDF